MIYILEKIHYYLIIQGELIIIIYVLENILQINRTKYFGFIQILISFNKIYHKKIFRHISKYFVTIKTLRHDI